MYVTNIKALKEDLKNNPLPETEIIKYLIFYLISESLGVLLPLKTENYWTFLIGLPFLVISIVGAFYCYRKNLGSSGSNFLQRFLSIGLVVSIRFILYLDFPLIFGIGIVLIILNDSQFLLSWYFAALMWLVCILTYWRIGYHIGQVAQNKNSESNINGGQSNVVDN